MPENATPEQAAQVADQAAKMGSEVELVAQAKTKTAENRAIFLGQNRS